MAIHFWLRTSVGSAAVLFVLTTASTSANAAEPKVGPVRFLREWGKEGTKPGEFYFPIGIAVSQTGEVFVTDHYNNRVQKFDPDGKLLAHFPVLPNPGGIAVDPDGNL